MKNKGRVIRVSQEIYDALETKKTSFKSWDSLLRCAFGFPARKGPGLKLQEFWSVPGSPRLFKTLAEAKGEAIKIAVRENSFQKKPVKLREVI